jgi:hypothetical protein
MTRIYTGDFSTGDLSQWTQVSNKFYTGYSGDYPGGYPVTVVSLDKDCGYVARFEVRDGDVPIFGGGQRSEVFGHNNTDALDGETTWYAFSIMFDEDFPNDHVHLVEPDDGWGVVWQLHDNNLPGSLYDPIITWGWGGNPDDTPAENFSLFQSPQLEDNSYDPEVPFASRCLLTLPMNQGNWHDIVMQIKHSSDPEEGFIKVWHNGVAQNLFGGGTTFTGQTLAPNADGQRVQLGYYRSADIEVTGVVYHTGFRMSDSADTL